MERTPILERRSFIMNDAIFINYAVLIPVSQGYSTLKGKLRTRYSPVRRFPLNRNLDSRSTCMY